MSLDTGTLSAAIAGDVLGPGGAGYEEARRPAIARFDQITPRALVRCTSADDVAAALELARSAGVAVAIRSGGHCSPGAPRRAAS